MYAKLKCTEMLLSQHGQKQPAATSEKHDNICISARREALACNMLQGKHGDSHIKHSQSRSNPYKTFCSVASEQRWPPDQVLSAIYGSKQCASTNCHLLCSSSHCVTWFLTTDKANATIYSSYQTRTHMLNIHHGIPK